MKRYQPRVGTPAPFASHHLFIATAVEDGFRSLMGDYLAIADDFFISGAVISTAPSGANTQYSITAGHLVFKGELMEVDAHNVIKTPSQVIWIDVQDDALDTSPVLNVDGNSDFVLRRRHARFRVGGAYPTVRMAIDSLRKADIDRIRNKGRLIPMGGIMPYYGALTDFDSSGLGQEGTVMEGFAICNGLNGTPDMRGKVALGATNVPDTGAAAVYAGVAGNTDPGDSSGADEVTLAANNLPAHVHPQQSLSYNVGAGSVVSGSGSNYVIDESGVDTGPNVTTNTPVSVKQASFSVVWLMSIV